MRKPHYESILDDEEVSRILSIAKREMRAVGSIDPGEYTFSDRQFIWLGAIGMWAEKNMPEFIEMERNAKSTYANYFVTFLDFESRGQKIYKMASDFSLQLDKTDLQVPAKFLPRTDGYICIEFSDDMRFEIRPGEYAQCVYAASFQPTSNGGYNLPLNGDSLVINFSVPTVNEKDVQVGQAMMNWTCRSAKDTIESTGFDKALVTHTSRESTVEFVRFALKCLLYISSGDPDLREAKPVEPPKTMKAKKLRQFYRDAQQSRLEMTLVGYSFKKAPIYTIEKTTVSGHFRWQPHGSGLSQIKLIWIDEHERRFNKDDASDSE